MPRIQSQTSFVDSLFNALDNSRDSLMDYLEKAAQRFPYDTGNFADGYLNGELCVVVHGHTRNVVLNSERQEVAFIFQHVARELAVIDDSRWRWDADHASHPSGHTDYDMQPPMAVLASAIMQDSQRASKGVEVLGMSVVRLYEFNPIPKLVTEFADVPTKFLSRFAIENGEYRELPMAFIGGGGAAVVDGRGAIHGTIESSSELIEELAENECEVSDRTKQDCTEHACPVVIHLRGESMGVFVARSVPLAFERLEMCVCPVKSLPAVFKSDVI
ncbi:MAG: hypothetical protein ACJ71S_05615 [Acidobacteriaceae bacterium]